MGVIEVKLDPLAGHNDSELNNLVVQLQRSIGNGDELRARGVPGFMHDFDLNYIGSELVLAVARLKSIGQAALAHNSIETYAVREASSNQALGLGLVATEVSVAIQQAGTTHPTTSESPVLPSYNKNVTLIGGFVGVAGGTKEAELDATEALYAAVLRRADSIKPGGIVVAIEAEHTPEQYEAVFTHLGLILGARGEIVVEFPAIGQSAVLEGYELFTYDPQANIPTLP